MSCKPWGRRPRGPWFILQALYLALKGEARLAQAECGGPQQGTSLFCPQCRRYPILDRTPATGQTVDTPEGPGLWTGRSGGIAGRSHQETQVWLGSCV